jgi:HSP20 family molecular chaperone IbpA
MSVARQLLHDLRPLFRVLEEPFGRSAGYYGLPTRSFFDDPLFQPSNSLRPSIDVTEEGDKYVVEADLPGVKKENVEVRIGDGGHSVTIEGKVVRRRNGFGEISEKPTEATVSATAGGSSAGGMSFHGYFWLRPNSSPSNVGSDAVTKADQDTTSMSMERPGSVMTSSSSFSRTVWLPRVVDENNVSAKLADGVLTVTIPKANDKASAKVAIE